MTAKLEQLKEAHNTLMVEYVKILNQVSKLPFFVNVNKLNYKHPVSNDSQANIIKRTYTSILPLLQMAGYFFFRIICIKYFVRLFIESHIKGKLAELKISYTHLSQSLSEDNPAESEFILWLNKTKESCDEFSKTLFSWRSIPGIIATLWPFGLSLLVSAFITNIYQAIPISTPPSSPSEPQADPYTAMQELQQEFQKSFGQSFQQELSTIIDIMNVLVYSIPFIFLLAAAFIGKRIIFLPGEDLWQQSSDNRPEFTRNVYEFEDKLFALLDRGKSREFPIDLLATFLIGVLLAYMATEREWFRLLLIVTINAEQLSEPFRFFDGLLFTIIGAKVTIIILVIGLFSIFLLVLLRRRK